MKYLGLACCLGWWLMSLGTGNVRAAIPEEDWHVAVVNGHRVYYAVHGSGPTLVLLHGGGDSGEHSFERQLDFLSEQHRIVAPDQVGQGRTPDGTQGIVAHQEFFLDVQALADCKEGLPLAVFGALTVAHVQRGGRIVTSCKRRADAGIHASAEQNNRAFS